MKTTSRNVVALGCMVAGALVAPAGVAQDARWYGGASLGRSAATIDDGRITSGLAGQGLGTSNIDNRDRDTGYRLFGGYQVNRNFGVEAGWFDLGEMGYTATTTPAGTLVGDVRFQGVNLDIVGTLPISDRFSLLGRIGGASVRTRGTFSSTGAVTMPYPGNSTSARRFGLKYGVGVAWRLTEAWELRVEGERMRVYDSVGNRGHVDLLSLGVVYYFGGVAGPARAGAPAPAYVAAPIDELRGVQYERIQVVGHTDRLESGAYNADLSRRRATAVAAYLVDTGIAVDRISSSGAGESDPLPVTAVCRGNAATPALITCLQPDRRVDLPVQGMRSP